MKFSNRSYFKTLLLFLPLLVIACGDGNQQQNSASQAPPAYPVLELQPRSIELTSSYPATLEGVQTVEIRPRLQGYIVEMPVDEGEIVEKGEVLFRLNSEEYEQQVRSAKADVEAAKAAVKTAEDEVQRYKNLVEKEIVSNYQLQRAQNTLQTRKASLAQAEAALENAQVNLGYTTIKSPTNGVIGTIPYRIGSLVSSTISRPLTIISDISKVYAYFSMSERELLEMAQSTTGSESNETLQQRINDMPAVNLRLADNSMYDHKGELRLASGLINSQTGSASFRAVFPNPQEILRSGASGNIQIPFTKEDAIVIPKKSTYELQNKRFVYVMGEDGAVESKEISVLPLTTKQLFVVDSGLSAGDKIVTVGMDDLNNGMKITPETVDSDSLYQALTVSSQ